jgi:hypothetical protein
MESLLQQWQPVQALAAALNDGNANVRSAAAVALRLLLDKLSDQQQLVGCKEGALLQGHLEDGTSSQGGPCSTSTSSNSSSTSSSKGNSHRKGKSSPEALGDIPYGSAQLMAGESGPQESGPGELQSEVLQKLVEEIGQVLQGLI